MSDQAEGPLVQAARTIGRAAGRAVAAFSGEDGSAAPKDNLWQAHYVGSGTFIIHKPKRKARKRRQQAVKNPRPGMR